MTLQTYMEQENLNLSQLAERLEISISYTREIMYGIREPSLRMIRQIEEKTGGQVTVLDLFIRPGAEPKAADTIESTAA